MVGLGLVMWQPNGAILWHVMEEFWYREHLKAGYKLVRTPHIGSRQLWETSGHWGFYNESMYPPLEIGQSLKLLICLQATKSELRCSNSLTMSL